jgi:hypothetical protein
VCRNFGSGSDYTWDNVLGITDEMKSDLSNIPKVEDIVINKQLDVVDWSNCKETLLSVGLEIVKDNDLDFELLESKTLNLNKELDLSNRELGALVSRLINGDENSGCTLIELILYKQDNELRLKSVVKLTLSEVIISDSLPMVYVTSDSRLEILNNDLTCLDTKMIINRLPEDKNSKILEVINKSSLIGLDHYTNKKIVSQISLFAECVNSDICFESNNIRFVSRV